MQKILLVVDGTAGAESALSVLRSMNKVPGSTVLVRVGPPGGVSQGEAPDREVGGFMGRYRRAVENGGTAATVKTLGQSGDPSREILKIAREERVDLIIMGSGRGNWFRRLFARDMTKEVETHAAVPVLVGRTSGGNKSISYGWRGTYAAQ
jgi:nucleotide-binding universal stress UspA family protein